jgi:polyisoprenyl-teichoic acid--peptidoglycan teichoic acid transferase
VSDTDPDKRSEQAPPNAGDSSEDGASAPKPSTWAGRERAGGEGGEVEEAPAAGEEQPEDADGEGPEEQAPEADEGELEEELDADEVAEEELAQELGSENGAGGSVDQDTVEADTPVLADREAAREAALAGLRARAAQHAAKQGTGVTALGEPPATAEKQPAAEQQAPPVTPAPPAASEEEEEKPPRRALWPRFLAGSFLIVSAIAAATAISLLFFLTGVVKGLRGLPSVGNQLAAADPGQPQTILLLGSDKRPQGQEVAHSDTTILLRVAPSQITLLSIPRDLKVNIPGHGIDRFNAAYTYGGPKLTLKVVKQLTGLDNINHVVNVNFTGFADAVNSVDCVYVDVDHHYYHSNAGLPLSEQYAEIDVPAGYQRMCGYNALQYVRYRHDDNDLVRSARQQEFLRDLRQQVPASKILDNFNQLVDILKKYVTSDIQKNIDLISLAKLFLAARGAPVVQVHFPANLGGPTASYVTASEGAIRAAVRKFEGEEPTATSPPSAAKSSSGSSGKKKQKQSKPSAPPLIDSSSSGQQYAAQMASAKTKHGHPMLDLPVYYPTKLTPGSTITSDSRAFPIDGPGNEVYHGYKLVVAVPTSGYESYYGVSGTDWKDPPILANPDETKTINGQAYLLSWDGPQLRLIGWKTDQGSYWVSNTLLNALSPGQMFAIAQSMQKYTG